MPVLSIGGEKANGTALAAQVKLVATNATSVILPNTGHWVMEENPSGATNALTRFLRASSSALPQMRMTPAEVAANQTGSDQIGSSGLAGVSTKGVVRQSVEFGFLYGRPVRAPRTRRFPRMPIATIAWPRVVSGTWQFGYWRPLRRRALKILPAGSVYSEPGQMNHFARNGCRGRPG